MIIYEKVNFLSGQNMIPENASMEKDLVQLKERVEEMSLDLRNIVTLLQSPQRSISRRGVLFDLLRDEAREKALMRLDAGMAKRCDMRKDCRQRFVGLLDDNLNLLERPRITEEDIRSRLDNLQSLRTEAVPGRCDGCFDEMGSLFQQQLELMRSLKLYKGREDVLNGIEGLPENEVVRDLLEPLSNVQRMVILKALSKIPRSFSELSSITNLRGGNLLFHLQRLTASEMISQRSGRGEYALSERGMRALEMVSDMYQRTSRFEKTRSFEENL